MFMVSLILLLICALQSLVCAYLFVCLIIFHSIRPRIKEMLSNYNNEISFSQSSEIMIEHENYYGKVSIVLLGKEFSEPVPCVIHTLKSLFLLGLCVFQQIFLHNNLAF